MEEIRDQPLCTPRHSTVPVDMQEGKPNTTYERNFHHLLRLPLRPLEPNHRERKLP